MADKLHHTSAQVISAIKGSGGIKQTVADRLGVHRNTIDRYLDRFPAAMQAYQDEVEAQGDYAETVLIWQLHEQEATGETDRNGNAIKKPTEKAVDMAWKYATKKLRSRGYGDVILNFDPKSLSVEQLERLIKGEDPSSVLSDAPKD